MLKFNRTPLLKYLKKKKILFRQLLVNKFISNGYGDTWMHAFLMLIKLEKTGSASIPVS